MFSFFSLSGRIVYCYMSRILTRMNIYEWGIVWIESGIIMIIVRSFFPNILGSYSICFVWINPGALCNATKDLLCYGNIRDWVVLVASFYSYYFKPLIRFIVSQYRYRDSFCECSNCWQLEICSIGDWLLLVVVCKVVRWELIVQRRLCHLVDEIVERNQLNQYSRRLHKEYL